MKIKQQKAQESAIKKQLKFEDYKHFLEATQLGNKINQLEKNKPDVDNLRKNKDLEVRNIMYLLKKLIRLH